MFNRIKYIVGATGVCAAAALSMAPAASAEGCWETQYNRYCESIMGWTSCDYDSDGTQINCEAGSWSKRDPRPDRPVTVKPGR